MMKLKKYIWRILQPLLLGTISNIVINYFFSPANPDFLLDEFLFAILLAIPITELNRIIDAYLEKKYSWIKASKKRFLYHFFLLMATMIFILNIVGFVYFRYKNINLDELITINIVTFITSIILTTLTWSSHFYKNWSLVEEHLYQTSEQLEELKLNIKQVSGLITLELGRKKFKIQASEIRMAKIELGIVRVWTQINKCGIFNESLTNLQKLLPENLFFMVNRNVIVHRDIIRSFSSASYGKISVEIDPIGENDKVITISRQKASLFRKWYNSTST